MFMQSGWKASAALAFVGTVAACNLNKSGNLGAPEMGDVTNPAERKSPIEALDAACGTGSLSASGQAVIGRRPYLQHTTDSSALVGWITSAPTPDQRVQVTLPDGTPVAIATAQAEAGAVVRRAGDKQMWTAISGLTPNTLYCYAVAGDGGQLVARSGFKTAPAAGSGAPVRFLAFGDSGSGGPDQLALYDQMYTVPFDLILHTGDIAYETGTIAQFEDYVFSIYKDLFRSLPFFPSPGNHEYDTLDAAPYRGVFALSNNERWYSYDWGDVHFVVLDTEMPLAEQAEWLEADLAATKLPWKIVYFHKPPYSSGKWGSNMSVRGAFQEIFEKYGVQLVLAGHDHDYERITPQNGVAYVVTGGGGRGTRTMTSNSFTAFASEVIHFVYGEVNGDNLILHTIDGEGTEFDSVVIRR